MNLARSCGLRFTLCAPFALFAAAATAQVPEATAVVGTFSGPSSSGTCGLFLVPLDGSPMMPITNLPPALQQPGGIVGQQGVYSVALRPSDGAILVGTVSWATGTFAGAIDLYVLHLSGTAVVATQHVPLAVTTGQGGAIVEMLPDERLLVGIATSLGSSAKIVDLSGPVPIITPIPMPAGAVPTSMGGGVAIDPSGQFAWYAVTSGMTQTPPTPVATVYRWKLATGQDCPIAQWTGQVIKGIACDDDGSVYVSMSDPNAITHSMSVIHTQGCTAVTPLTTPSALPLPPADLDLDRSTGKFVVATPFFAPGFSYRNSVALVDNAGTTSILAAPPPAGWGVVNSIAVNNRLDSYGWPSNGMNHYWFETFPNPAGEPLLGNAGFSLTMHSDPGVAALSLLGLSLGRATIPFLGIEVLLDPGSVVLSSVSVAPTASYPLPIPNNPALVGFEVFAQGLHLESNLQAAASRGLKITIE